MFSTWFSSIVDLILWGGRLLWQHLRKLQTGNLSCVYRTVLAHSNTLKESVVNDFVDYLRYRAAQLAAGRGQHAWVRRVTVEQCESVRAIRHHCADAINQHLKQDGTHTAGLITKMALDAARRGCREEFSELHQAGLLENCSPEQCRLLIRRIAEKARLVFHDALLTALWQVCGDQSNAHSPGGAGHQSPPAIIPGS